ncbi:MAG: peptide ABC transporter substrate-binding protein [Spirochaetaceae bacterium]|nr:MAG: peptide ABC transporter substrate-binding protein [Spirochaetaceae bacterium]
MKKFSICVLAVLISINGFSGSTPEDDGAAAELSHFVFNNAVEPESLDPALILAVPAHIINLALFEGLVTYDPKTVEAVPGVAESWEISDDGMTYTFKLRSNALWSDGTPITAQQFVESWLRLLDPETAALSAYMMTMVVEGADQYNLGQSGPEAVQIRALDDHTFQFDLIGPVPYALDMLSHPAFSVHPIHVIEKYGREWIHPDNFVGNGPFLLEEWIPHYKIVVRKSETYWDRDNVGLGKITFLCIEDDNTALNMYLKGQVDWIGYVPGARLEEMKLHDDYHCGLSFITYFYRFNINKVALNDHRVRKALAMSIDRQELVDRVTRGGEIPAFGLTPPLPRYPAVIGFREDLATARSLLAEAGFPGGEGFPRLTLLYNTHEGHKRIAEYVQQLWSDKLGLEVEIENKEWNAFLASLDTCDFDIARAGWMGTYLDPNTFLDLWTTESEVNSCNWSNPEFDSLIEKAAEMPAGQERLELLRKAEQILISEEMAVLPLYYYTRMNWIDTDVWGGWYENLLDVHPWKAIYKK